MLSLLCFALLYFASVPLPASHKQRMMASQKSDICTLIWLRALAPQNHAMQPAQGR